MSQSNSPELMAVLNHLKQLSSAVAKAPADIAHRRELLDTYFAVSPETLVSPISPKKITVSGRDAYWFVPESSLGGNCMLYLHGGSWMSGSIKGWQAYVARLAQECQCNILFIDYSLMPEAPFPAGLNDCLAAYLWLRDQYSEKKIFIAGDSAGGNLTLACLLALKEKRLMQPDAALAISPCTDFSASGETMNTHHELDPIINPQGIPLLGEAYMKASELDMLHPFASPLFGELTGLPPLMLQTGEAEVLLDDSLRFAAKAKCAGVEVELDVWPDMPHVFQGFAPYLPQASQAIVRIADFFHLHSR